MIIYTTTPSLALNQFKVFNDEYNVQKYWTITSKCSQICKFFFSPIPYDVLASGSSDEAIVLPISAALHPISTQKRDTFAAALSTISRSEKIRSPVPMTPPTKPLIKSFVVKCTSWSDVYSTRLRRPQSFHPTSSISLRPWPLVWLITPTYVTLTYSWLILHIKLRTRRDLSFGSPHTASHSKTDVI